MSLQMYDNTFLLIQDALAILDSIETYEEDSQQKLDSVEKLLRDAMFNEPRYMNGILSNMG